jgi:hypothetical protein
LGNTADGGAGDASGDPQGTPWMQSGYICPFSDLVAAATDGGLATNGLSNAGVMWPTLAADGDNFHLPARNAQYKSHLLISWSQTTNEIDGGAFPAFSQVFQGNSDPVSANFNAPATWTDKFQTLTALGFGTEVYGPALSDAATVTPNLNGQYNSIAVQLSSTICQEDAGFDASTSAADPSSVCHGGRFWPFWIENPGGSNSHSIIATRTVVFTN